MKKIIRKFWGVGLIVILLSTLFVGGTVPAASGATLAWSATGLPGGLFNPLQIAAGTDVSIVKVAPNGDIFIVDQLAVPNIILKSVNGGRSWTPAVFTTIPALATASITALAISPAYATDGYVYAVVNTNVGVGPSYVYQSANAGATFGQLGVNVSAIAPVIGTSIALDPTYNAGVGGIIVGLADVTTGIGPVNGVVTWSGAPTYAWLPVGSVLFPLAEDVTAVAYSPNYPIDRAIIAVSSDPLGTGTYVHVKVHTNDWDAPSYYPPVNINAAIGDLGVAVTGILASSLAIPSDFNAANPATRTLYVGTSSSTAANDDVYRVYLLPGVGGVLTDLGIIGPLAGASINNLSYTGTTATGALYAGATLTATFSYSLTPNGLAAGWIPGGVVTGAASAYVAANGATVYVGTTGAESALNVSTDGGANFTQKGYIDTIISAIQDFVPFSATEWYMVTQNVGNTAANPESLWKTADGGATWVRLTTIAQALPTAGTDVVNVRLSPGFAADKTMYVFEVGAVGLGVAPILRMSSDAGMTWTQHWFDTASTGVGINDLVVVDKFTMYAASAGAATVYKTSNNGFWWTAQALPLGAPAFQLKRDAVSGALLAGTTAGAVYLSTTGLTWAPVGGPAGATGNTYVAFDAGYSTNSIIYAGDGTGAGVGVSRFNNATPLAPWVQIIDPLVTPIPAACLRGIVVSPDGVLYAADVTAATLIAGGMVRILAPTTGIAGFPPFGEVVTGTDGLVLGTTLSSLAYTAGSNVLYGINTVGLDSIVTYTDTLSVAIPAVTSPLIDAVVLAPAPAVTISPVTGATDYRLQWSARADWLGLVGNAAVAYQPFPTSAFVLAAVPAGSTIYYRVRVIAPVFGPWSQQYTFVTQLTGAVAPNAPIINALQPAANGGINVPIKPVFTWSGVPGATGYEFQLAKDAAMTNLVVDATGAAALGVEPSYAYAGELKYSTTYYWRVKGISGTSFTQWSVVQSFTTAAMPPVVAPPVIIPPQVTPTVIVPTPTVTVNMPTPTVTEVNKQINPSYIWAIIIIGAVLVLAVIVLIVRTRRPV